MVPSILRPAGRRILSLLRILPLLLIPPIVACGDDAGDPVLDGLAAALAPDERLLQMQLLDPESPAAVAAVVQEPGGGQELRIYEREGDGLYRARHRSRQGDHLTNLELEDVTGNGREEILATWSGGRLEILEVVERRPDGSYETIFENGGRGIERRDSPDGGREIRVTSRTYEEEGGEPPAYEMTIYRYDGDRFALVPR
ncbi:MAG: hypothetical protein V3U83_09440 [Acidobacteriota bacterium]